jgi:predicted TIM-barrel fold metal-dependent hydrolase
MDEFGIHSQILYPNVGGFGSGSFSEIKDPELNLLCVEAYNDFLADYSRSAPGRFVSVMALPFWDVDLSLREIERSKSAGHKGVNITADPESWGMPPYTTRHWDPIWEVCQDLELPVSFHIAGGKFAGPPAPTDHGVRAAFVSGGGLPNLLGNAQTLAQIIAGGVCHRFPKLDFISVESGIGWLQFALESLDFIWQYCGVGEEHPEYGLLPSEYFQRQIYGTFWYEQKAAVQAIEALGPDNLMYSTDFPHPTCMSDGIASVAQAPRDYVESALADVPESALRKVLHDNAARVFHLN